MPAGESACGVALCCLALPASDTWLASLSEAGWPACRDDPGSLPCMPCRLQVDPARRPTATQLLAMPYFADPASWLSPEFKRAQVGGRQ